MALTRRLVCIGLSHQTAPVDLRERVRCTLDALLQQQKSCEAFAPIRELAVLSTCNRLELYAAVAVQPGQEHLLTELLCSTCAIAPDELSGHLYVLHGAAVHRHLAAVAAGLDSLVLGEPQILGQVTSAYLEAVARKSIGRLLTAAMRSAIRAGKRTRHETSIGCRPTSISSVAVSTAAALLGQVQTRTVVVIGVGEMGAQALKALQARNVSAVTLVNRTMAKAAVLAGRFGYQAAEISALPHLLTEADLVISATGAPGVILTAAMLEEAQSRRNGRPLLLVDIALPRDIETNARRIDGIRLVDIDELNTSMDDALSARRQEIPHVHAIIDQECARFDLMMRELSVAPLVADFRQQAEQIRQHEVERTLRFLSDADPATVMHIEQMTKALVNKLLHKPTAALKQSAVVGATAYAETIQALFGLGTTDEETRL